VLTADRGQLTRRGTVTFTLDVQFERPMGDIAQAIAEGAGAVRGGDLMREQPEVKVDAPSPRCDSSCS